MAEGGSSRAGFVLVGGNSSRMGRDKALLEFQGETLAARVAECVRQAAGSVTLIGPPERYRELGYNVIADRAPGLGPLGGVYTALHATHSEWNLIVAVDMPLITLDLLAALLEDAESGASTADCVIPEHAGAEGPLLEPLCAVYQRRCAQAARRAIDRNILKMHDFVSHLRLRTHAVKDPAALRNVNTPHEWSAL